MALFSIATTDPLRPAVTMANGISLSYAELERRSDTLARHLRAVGLQTGDRFALLLENRPEYFVAMAAARRAGLYFVPLNWHLHESEAAYVVADSCANAMITSSEHRELATRLCDALGISIRLSFDLAGWGFTAIDALDPASLPDFDNAVRGGVMPYSSGTTGRPKGIVRPLEMVPPSTLTPLEALYHRLYGVDSRTVFLCPAPLYHSAPISFSQSVHQQGGTVVLLASFDAHAALEAIDRYRVNVAQFVPTHFVRMLKLPPEVRERYSLRSLEAIVHAAAPCSPEVKRRIIDWLGPKIYELYGGSERCGVTSCTSKEWLERPGTVGRSKTGALHIVDPESGLELPPGEIGLVYFESPDRFSYQNVAPEKGSHFSPEGWGTYGDLGRVDDDGYLFLADRRADLIVSGGVNIYPAEVENALVLHAAVADVAVIGIPHDEFGQQVKAIVEPAQGYEASKQLADDLLAHCRSRLSSFKCPRSIDFRTRLPRHPNGKLLRRELRAEYLEGQQP